MIWKIIILYSLKFWAICENASLIGKQDRETGENCFLADYSAVEVWLPCWVRTPALVLAFTAFPAAGLFGQLWGHSANWSSFLSGKKCQRCLARVPCTRALDFSTRMENYFIPILFQSLETFPLFSLTCAMFRWNQGDT